MGHVIFTEANYIKALFIYLFITAKTNINLPYLCNTTITMSTFSMFAYSQLSFPF